MTRFLLYLARFACGWSGHPYVTVDHQRYLIYKIVCPRCGLVAWDGGFDDKTFHAMGAAMKKVGYEVADLEVGKTR